LFSLKVEHAGGLTADCAEDGGSSRLPRLLPSACFSADIWRPALRTWGHITARL
jgi:hypothetical protein